MSVTESKAKKVKKASLKASTRKADAQSEVLVAVLDSAPVSYTAWSRLFIGDLNCRLIPHTPEEIRHCCKVSDEAAFCLIQRPYISKTLLTRRISPRGSP
ncbi:hypothetical protein DMT28_11740 [Salmonella enterica]|nr:hypothetical protein [Salmonella enterica]